MDETHSPDQAPTNEHHKWAIHISDEFMCIHDASRDISHAENAQTEFWNGIAKIMHTGKEAAITIYQALVYVLTAT